MGNEGNPIGVKPTSEAGALPNSPAAGAKPVTERYIPVSHLIDLEADAEQNYRPLRPGENPGSFDPDIMINIGGEPHVMTRGAKLTEKLASEGAQAITKNLQRTFVQELGEKIKAFVDRPRLARGRTRTGIPKGYGRYSHKKTPRS